MLSNHIKDLLNTDGRIIVPNLGAFMLKGSPKPTLYFNEFLRYNDGILIDFVAEKDHIDKNAASEKVKNFVDHVNQQLQTSKSAELEGLGILFVDSKDKIQIKTDGSSHKTVKPEIKTPVPAEKDNTSREVYFEIEKTEIAASPKPEEKKTTVIQPHVETAQVPPQNAMPTSEKQVVPPTIPPTKTVSHTQQVRLQSPPKAPPSTPSKIVASGKKSNAGWWVVLLIVIAGAGVYFGYYNPVWKKLHLRNITIGKIVPKDSVVKKDTASKPPDVNSDEQAQAVKPEDNIKEQPKPEVNVSKPKVQPKKPASKTENTEVAEGGKKYYLVAGCFSVEANADKMAQKLKGEGFEPVKFITKKSNLFYVSYSSFSDKASAGQELHKLKAGGKESVWILCK